MTRRDPNGEPRKKKFKARKTQLSFGSGGEREGYKGRSIGVKMQNSEGSVLKQSVKW